MVYRSPIEQRPDRTLRLACVLGAGLMLAAGTLPATTYEVESFEFPGAPITGGRGLDDGSCQVGYYQTDAMDFSTAHALRRCDGVLETIDPPTSISDRRAFDINNAGVVVGSAQRATGNDAFELDGGTYTWVEFPGADQTVIRGINDAGDVVGEYENASGPRNAFMRIGGVFTTINVPLAAGTRARGINNLGEIVGHWEDAGGLRHGFIREANGIITTLDFPGATETLFGDINDQGEIVGTYFDSSGTPHGLMITAPLVQFLTFEYPGAAGTLVTGINEDGWLTGEWVDGAGVRRGFVAESAVFADDFEAGSFSAWDSTQP